MCYTHIIVKICGAHGKNSCDRRRNAAGNDDGVLLSRVGYDVTTATTARKGWTGDHAEIRPHHADWTCQASMGWKVCRELKQRLFPSDAEIFLSGNGDCETAGQWLWFSGGRFYAGTQHVSGDDFLERIASYISPAQPSVTATATGEPVWKHLCIQRCSADFKISK